MADKRLVELLEIQQEQLRPQQEQYQKQQEMHRQEMYTMMKAIERFSQQATTSSDSIAANITTVIPKFQPFDSTSELWTDYWKRFQTFFGANSVQDSKKAQTFLTNQSNAIYKFLANMASQLTPKKEINELSLNEIV